MISVRESSARNSVHLSSYQKSKLQQVLADLIALYTRFLQYRIVFSYHRWRTRSTMFGCGKVLGSPRILNRSTAAPRGSDLRHIIRNSSGSSYGPRASSRLCCAFLLLLLILTPRVDSSWWWVESSIPARLHWRTLARRNRAVFFFPAHGDRAAVILGDCTFAYVCYLDISISSVLFSNSFE